MYPHPLSASFPGIPQSAQSSLIKSSNGLLIVAVTTPVGHGDGEPTQICPIAGRKLLLAASAIAAKPAIYGAANDVPLDATDASLFVKSDDLARAVTRFVPGAIISRPIRPSDVGPLDVNEAIDSPLAPMRMAPTEITW